MNFILKTVRGAACLAITALTCALLYYNAALPDNYVVTEGGRLFLSEYLQIDSEPVIPVNYPEDKEVSAAASPVGYSGEHTEQLRLFGIFPIKEVNVTEVSSPVVVPCGTPFGIKILTEGVLVVELTGFDNGSGICSPARDAGIDEGDVIVSISGKKVTSNKDVSGIIEDSGGKALGVELVRDGRKRVVFIKPDKSVADGCFHAGMWVRDSSAGIGTVTFYDPDTMRFAGLGHPVCDTDTGDIMTMSRGEAVDVTISGIRKSSEGAPGELIGMFSSDRPVGKIISNEDSGVYGIMDSCPTASSAVPVAMRQEIVTGPAVILATINGSRPEQYSVEIERIELNGGESSHDLVIHVTDERLLNDAGGIVQGMSGSPIIQNGRLVGAVTHVFVRDPTRGYGIFADTMLSDLRSAA